MTIKEAFRLAVMEQIGKKILSLSEASLELGISPRQAKRLYKRYKGEGPTGLISRRRGKPNVNKIPEEIRERVLRVLGDPKCSDWGPTFAQEKLASIHQICLSEETLRKWMSEAGLWKIKTKKQKRIYQRRTRRRRFGELLQGDGSHHDWFEGRGEKSCLLIFVDDATSKITSGQFSPTETTEGYLRVLDKHLRKYGVPRGLYVDKHAVFRVNRKDVGSTEAETHFGKVLRDLGTDLICAHSPQAKGRVERANSTLQDRLIKEMRIKGISSIEEANVFLPEFIEEYNEKFGKEAADQEDAHRPLVKSEEQLERIFARKESRKLSKDLTFSYEGSLYQLETNSPNRVQKTSVDIIIRPGKPLIFEVGGKEYKCLIWKDIAYRKPQILDCKELEALWRKEPKKPSKHHPWKQGLLTAPR